MTQAPDQRPRLLLVDDEPTNLQVLRHVLQADYRLLFATDGARALQVAREQQPQLILLDIMMPGMDGYAVCRALKADPATAGIPVIFITALDDSQDETAGFDAGAVDYITKPVSPPVVRAGAHPPVAGAAGRAARNPPADRAAPGPRGRVQGQ